MNLSQLAEYGAGNLKSSGVRTIPRQRVGDSGPIMRTIKVTDTDKHAKGKEQKSFAQESSRDKIRNYILDHTNIREGIWGNTEVSIFNDDYKDRRRYVSYTNLLDGSGIKYTEHRNEFGHLIISVKNRDISKAKDLMLKI